MVTQASIPDSACGQDGSPRIGREPQWQKAKRPQALCEEAVRIAPNFATGYGCLAVLQLGDDDAFIAPNHPVAIDYAKQALGIDPMEFQSHITLAVIEEQTLRVKSAEKRLRNLITRFPSNGLPRVNYAQVLQTLGRLDEALEQARRSAALEPLVQSIQANLGEAHLRVGNDDEALMHLERAAALGSMYRGAWWSLALAYHANGRDAEALEAFLTWFSQAMDEKNRNEIEGLLRRGFADGGFEGANLALADAEGVPPGFCAAPPLAIERDHRRAPG